MEAYLLHLLTQSLAFTLFIVMLVTFLESLALVGMLLPGTVMMTSVGALIGSGEVDFYFAWVAATLGCLLGDWISYFIGRRFKAPLHNWSFLQKHKSLLNKTEHALHNHSMATVLLGRFYWPDTAHRTHGGWDAELANGKVCLTQCDWWPDMAADLSLPRYIGRGCHRYPAEQ